MFWHSLWPWSVYKKKKRIVLYSKENLSNAQRSTYKLTHSPTYENTEPFICLYNREKTSPEYCLLSYSFGHIVRTLRDKRGKLSVTQKHNANILKCNKPTTFFMDHSNPKMHHNVFKAVCVSLTMYACMYMYILSNGNWLM